LKKIGRQALLPAGIIMTGGGAGLNILKEFAESALKLPSKVAEIHFGDTEKFAAKDSMWAVSYGLAILGFNAENEQKSVGLKGVEQMAERGKRGLRTLSGWIGRFLP
jgi:cell division ATPase FtsA